MYHRRSARKKHGILVIRHLLVHSSSEVAIDGHAVRSCSDENDLAYSVDRGSWFLQCTQSETVFHEWKQLYDLGAISKECGTPVKDKFSTVDFQRREGSDTIGSLFFYMFFNTKQEADIFTFFSFRDSVIFQFFCFLCRQNERTKPKQRGLICENTFFQRFQLFFCLVPIEFSKPDPHDSCGKFEPLN